MHNIILAIALVETGSVKDSKILGDHGRAAGPLQIHREVILDVNCRYHTSYKWPADCYSFNTSSNICVKYLNLYARDLSVFDTFRIWNGGPSGANKISTISYGKKCIKHFKQ